MALSYIMCQVAYYTNVMQLKLQLLRLRTKCRKIIMILKYGKSMVYEHNIYNDIQFQHYIITLI